MTYRQVSEALWSIIDDLIIVTFRPRRAVWALATAMLVGVLVVPVAAQTANKLPAPTGVPTEKSDPTAKKLLDKIRKKYETYKTMEAAFTLTIEVPGQPKEVQSGTVAQSGDQFRLTMPQQVIVNDGKTTWVYQKKANEVQINKTDPNNAEGDFMTPKELLRRYQKGDFLYTLTDKVTEGGKLLTQIEFKPKDKNSEYSKLRLSIDEKGEALESIRAFAKDGSRYTFKVTRFSPNKAFAASTFTFDTKQFPGVRVEDLRY